MKTILLLFALAGASLASVSQPAAAGYCNTSYGGAHADPLVCVERYHSGSGACLTIYTPPFGDAYNGHMVAVQENDQACGL